MQKRLQILNLGDSREDAELIREKMKEEGVVCEIRHVDTEKDFTTALENTLFDLVLADFTLSSFDGMSALAIVREKFPSMPFIFVSGTIGEEKAIDVLKSGATDYVRKGNLSRLAPAVRRALKEAEDKEARRQAEREREISIEFLRLVNESTGTRALIRAATTFFQQQSGCEAVGIRLREGEDYPYFEARGFPKEFVLAENSLCARDSAGCVIRGSSGNPVIECMCGNVICGRFDPAKSFFTKQGSFWTNNTTELLRRTTEADRQARTRNRCNGEGYESVALLPLRVGEERLGLLQLNDRRTGVFSSEVIGQWERLADQLAVALAKFLAEDALRQVEARFSTVFHNSPIGIVVSGLDDGTFYDVNDAFLNVYGYSREEVIGRTSYDLNLWSRREEREAMVGMLREQGRVKNLEAKFRKKSGEIGSLLISAERIELNGEERLLGMFTDITERRKFEEQLRESESKFRSLAEQTLVGIYIVQNYVFKYVNPRLAEMFGYPAEEIIDSKGPRDLTVPEDRHIIEQAAERQASTDLSISHYEARGLKKSGDIIHAEIFGSRAYYLGRPAIIGIVLDVTEKKKLENQLRQAQKMEAIGQLTSGIAHDFNNILSAIIGYASLLQMKMTPDDPQRLYVDQILAGTDRAASLTRSLLTFSRKQLTNLQPVNINENIRKVETLLLRTIGEDIDLRSELAPGDLIVNADAGQIDQVLMNLATNARDAMQQGGILSIETSVVESDELGAGPAGDGKQRYVRILVTDTGVGMDEKTREKIFEPFFTTKDLGRGTGLGLSMVYGIIKQHNGDIRCYSEPGTGTTFKIYLPLLAAAASVPAAASGLLGAENRLQGTETILVAEDDEVLRGLAKSTLESFGYTVITAVDGKDAVGRFLENRGKIGLVLCDVIMPRMNGGEVGAAVRKNKPDARILFMSGYPADFVQQKSMLEEGAEVILKPFSPIVLARKVREALDKK